MNNSDGLSCDPYNLVITGVGGQGNVLASRVVGDMLMQQGYQVTIGETFGASQRGGAVMSHLRISGEGVLSPQIPRGNAHMVVALEPTEAIRVLGAYGNPSVNVVCNTRPIQSAGVICGEQTYPAGREIERWITELSARAWFIDTTEAALQLGSPIYGNIMAVGALSATGDLPLPDDVFESVIARRFSADKVSANLRAFEVGKDMVAVN